jgi:hypothetical protein
MAQLTDLEKAYLVGYRDGYRHAMKETWHKADELADLRAELQAVHAELARMRAIDSAADGGVETERDPATRLN